MTDVAFGRLVELPLREAWKHEALEFTPWLAANIDHLADAIGMPLELTGQEVRVDTFAADILARNPSDDSIVLIENQLEQTDHTHLGQIMTYLAGLDAQTVIWIAPSFRQPHLSAIRWLNQHTADGFAFFAVKARVVRIGDSPFAPIFEVVEQPNNWEREIKRKTSTEGSAYYDIKQEFWQAFLDKYPAMGPLGVTASRYPSAYITVCDAPKIDVSIWIGRHKSGIYVRSGWGEPAEPVADVLNPHKATLEASLEASLGPSGRGLHFLPASLNKGHDKRESWLEIMKWMEERVAAYRAALKPILNGGTA